MSLTPESRTSETKTIIICWLNDFKPGQHYDCKCKYREWISRWTQEQRMIIKVTNDYRLFWLHSMNDTNSNCDLGQIIRIIGLVWTRLVSQFIHSFIHWWTNAWRIIVVLSDSWHESMWTLSHVQWAWITQSRLTCSSLRDGLHFDSGNFNSRWP